MRCVFEEDFDVCERLFVHQFLVHIGLPGEVLDIFVVAHVDETLAAFVG